MGAALFVLVAGVRASHQYVADIGDGCCEYGFLHTLGRVHPMTRAEGHCPPKVDL